MLDPLAIRLVPQGSAPRREVFSVSACSADGSVGFSLRHVLLRQVSERHVTVQNILTVYDRRTGSVLCTHEQEDVAPTSVRSLRGGRWDHFSYNFASGSFFEISAGRLRGKMHTRQGSASWDMSLQGNAGSLIPFPAERLYRLPWPPIKLTTPEASLVCNGRISCAGVVLNGDFHGGSRHDWSSSRARDFAYASCTRLEGADDAFFVGASARFPVVSDWVSTPYFSIAMLKAGGQWHAFNALLEAPRHTVHALDNYRWLATFMNPTHRLDVTVDGANPRVEPWIALQERWPDGHRVVSKSTLFAAGRLRLYERRQDKLVAELASDVFSLETQRPDNVAVGEGLVGKA